MTVPFPTTVAPMKAVAAEHLPPDDGEWAFEVKWDGMRVIAFVDGVAGTVRLQSSNLIDVTVRFPELAGLVDALGGQRAVLDGEVVALDDHNRPSFGRLQERMHVDDPREARRRAALSGVTFLAFDLLHLDGSDVTGLAYRDRRRLLDSVLDQGSCWGVPPYRTGDGDAFLEASRSAGLEGVMAKRLDSPYEPGRRSPAWRKVKNRRRQEVVIAGWSEGTGRRAGSGSFGALLVGVYDGGRLRFAGKVGTGFSDSLLAELRTRLDQLAVAASPFNPAPPTAMRRNAHWVQPLLVGEVAFAEWTDEGVMRHPSFLGLHADKDPLTVVREPA